MLEFLGVLSVVMVIATVILFPVSMWFGKVLTQEPSYFGRWILQRLFIKVRDPHIAVVSPAAATPPNVIITAGLQIGGSESELDIEIASLTGTSFLALEGSASATRAPVMWAQ
jgi:hypothetical protein